jgi:hypothetical protein
MASPCWAQDGERAASTPPLPVPFGDDRGAVLRDVFFAADALAAFFAGAAALRADGRSVLDAIGELLLGGRCCGERVGATHVGSPVGVRGRWSVRLVPRAPSRR